MRKMLPSDRQGGECGRVRARVCVTRACAHTRACSFACRFSSAVWLGIPCLAIAFSNIRSNMDRYQALSAFSGELRVVLTCRESACSVESGNVSFEEDVLRKEFSLQGFQS
jgi:hypothetical protein